MTMAILTKKEKRKVTRTRMKGQEEEAMTTPTMKWRLANSRQVNWKLRPPKVTG